MTVREAVPADAGEIARVHVDTWRDTLCRNSAGSRIAANVNGSEKGRLERRSLAWCRDFSIGKSDRSHRLFLIRKRRP